MNSSNQVTNLSLDEKNNLVQLALDALKFAHSPYSSKRIGSSIKLSNGKIYSGCNIENASYGGTVCAERVAIFKAFSENMKPVYITHVIVASEENEPWPPCGFCRQVITEFAYPDTQVILVNPSKKEKALIFSELFPMAFSPEHLK